MPLMLFYVFLALLSEAHFEIVPVEKALKYC